MSPEGHDPSASGSMAGPDPMIGQVLDGRYRVLTKLGEGGMGEVYAAEHVHIEKRVAVKLLRAEIVANKEAVSRFRQEARSASSIGHKNIIAIEDFGTISDGRIYLCMELLQGAAFNDMLKDQLPVDRLLNILIQTGHGLAAAHAKDIVHRDMKPENIFVTTGDVPKLLDFGIAKVSGADGQNHLTRTGTIFGTPFYMAPEQALGQAVDHRADIYAMGVIMYEVFSGSIPFQGESFMGILTQHITAEPKPVSVMAKEHGRQVPAGIEEIIVKAMKKDPEERYQTMDELVNVLVAVYRGQVGSGMSSYMEAHVPASAMMETVAAPVAALGHGPSSSMPAAHPPAPTPIPAPHPSGPSGPAPHPGPHGPQNPQSSGYANVAVRHPSSGHQPRGQQGYPSAGSSVYEIPKKSKAGPIIAILLVLGLTGGGLAFYFLGMNNEEEGTADAGVVAQNDIDAGGGVVDSDASTDVGSTLKDAGTVVATKLDGSVVAVGKQDAAPVEVKLDAGTTVTPSTRIKVTIRSTPSGATVYKGSRRLGTTPHTVDFKVGSRSVTYKLTRDGYHSTTVKVNGKRKRVSGKLRKKADITPPPTDPCKINRNSIACACKKPSSLKCKCKKNPKDPACALE